MLINGDGAAAVRSGTVSGVNPALATLIDRTGGLVSRSQAAQVVPGWVLEHACRRGHLHRVLPGVYRDPAVPPTPSLRRRAALAWLDGRGALSHTTALAGWGLHEPGPNEPVHVTVPAGVRLRSHPGFAVHRRRPFAVEPPYVLIRGGQPVVRLERSVVESWPLLPAADRRIPVIRAVNDRLTTPDRLRAERATIPKLSGCVELDQVIGLLATGCRSPLEIFGHEQVFTAAGMPEFRRQVRISIDGRTTYLDVFAEQEKVNFELDGASVHADPRQRERDLRRDARLGTLGIMVVRFSHYRLVHEPAAVRQEVRDILAHRRWRTALLP